MDNWGTNCGSIQLEQGTVSTDRISGCLASCDFDGCNTATNTKPTLHLIYIVLVIGYVLKQIRLPLVTL